MSEATIATKKMLKTIQDKYGDVSEYYSEKGKKARGIPKLSGFGSDKIGKDGLTGRERAKKVSKLGGRPRKKLVYGQANYKKRVGTVQSPSTDS